MSSDADLYFEECGDLLCVLSGGTTWTSLTIDKVNRRWTTLLGWSKEDVVGKLFTDQMHIDQDELREGTTSAQTALSALLSQEEPISIGAANANQAMLEERFCCKNGSTRWIAWNITRLSSQKGFVACGRDITLNKESEAVSEASFERERRLKESQEIAKLGQWDLDLTTNDLVWSSEIYRLFKIDPMQFGASYEAFLNAIHPDDREKVNSAYTTHLETREPYEIIHRLLFDDGSIKWVIESCRSEFDDASGRPLRSVGTVQDITELKQAQEDLRAAKERAEEADGLKSAFLANMSHEIRTPMNAVIGFTDLMLMDSKGMADDHREYLETIKTSGKLLLMLINDILDISKIEAGQLHLEYRSFSLGYILKTVEYNVAALINRKGHHIDFHTPLPKSDGTNNKQVTIPGVEDTIIGDPNRLQQVLNNLLSNAVKFTDEGKISYEVKILVRPSGSMLEFSVSDSGIGIPQDKQEDIFQPFRQVQGGRGVNNTLGGTGLGLAIARRLVEMMGGQISLESSTDQDKHGSTFRFTIPYVLANARVDENHDESEAKSGSSESQSKLPKLSGKVLLVDDNRINLKLAGRFLKSMGCFSEDAENGRIAISKFEADPSFKAILMDKEMPVMDGLEAVQHIRRIEVTENRRRIPIVAVTAAAMAGDREECLEAGCDDYITKPLNRTALHRMLAKYLKP